MSDKPAEEEKVVSLFSGQPVETTLEELENIENRKLAIEQLEGLLEEFRNGIVNGFAMSFRYATGQMGSFTSYEIVDYPVEYIGGLQRLIHRINVQTDEIYEDEP